MYLLAHLQPVVVRFLSPRARVVRPVVMSWLLLVLVRTMVALCNLSAEVVLRPVLLSFRLRTRLLQVTAVMCLCARDLLSGVPRVPFALVLVRLVEAQAVQ